MIIDRRRFIGTSLAAAGAAATPVLAAARPYEPSAELVAAARRDGGFVNYTAQIEDLELETIAAFNKRFPS